MPGATWGPTASIAKRSRSTGGNPTPVPAGAGKIRRLTGAPLCKPTPRQPTGVRTVCSKGKLFQMKRLHRIERPWTVVFLQHIVAVKELLLTALVKDWCEIGRGGMGVVGDAAQKLMPGDWPVVFEEG